MIVARPSAASDHAVDRYLERLRPGLDRGSARRQLEAAAAAAELVGLEPRSLAGSGQALYWTGHFHVVVDSEGVVRTVLPPDPLAYLAAWQRARFSWTD